MLDSYWLLPANVMLAMQRGAESMQITAEQQESFLSARAGAGGFESGERILTVEGNRAIINVEGVLTQKPNLLAMIFGGGNTAYPEITGALAAAQANKNITSATARFASPGGSVNGMFEAIAAFEAFDKPLTAEVSTATSAAYGLASQADEIVAVNRAAEVGSVGIAATIPVANNEVIITSSEAPDKMPDPETEEGKATIRENLDAYHDLFAESIATGRNTTVKNVNANFGRGSTLLADAALAKGMIDRIATDKAELSLVGSQAAHRQSPAAAGGSVKTLEKTMDLQTLQAQHPDVYLAAVGVGIDEERARITGHLKMGKSAGAMDIAMAAIETGGNVEALIPDYMAAQCAKHDLKLKGADDLDLPGITDTGDQGDQQAAETKGKEVLTLVSRQMGQGSAFDGLEV